MTRRLLTNDAFARYGTLVVLAAAAAWAAVHVFDAATGPPGLRAGLGFGPDLIAFRAAAELLSEVGPLAPYAAEVFVARTSLLFGAGDPGLLYQYPPTAYLLFAPLAWAPYPVAAAGFVVASASLMAFSLRGAGWNRLGVALGMASPPVLLAIGQGQVTTLTTACLVTATTQAHRRPVLAGAAAAALTIKPQLGLLLPPFFLLIGARRAFAVAGLGTLALVGVSLALFGASAWTAFFDAAARLSDDMRHGTIGYTPVEAMVSPFALAYAAGLPEAGADIVHWTLAALAGGVALRSARTDRPHTHKAAALCAASALVSPYGYVYEAALLVFPVGVLIQGACARGWRHGERATLAFAGGIFVLKGILPHPDLVQWYALATLAAAAVCLLRFGGRARAGARPPPSALASVA